MIDLRLLAVEETERPATAADRAAALRRCCGHVAASPELVDRGYRFYPMPGGDLPHFFCKRLDAGGGRTASVTLLGGLDAVSGEPVLEDCRSTVDARATLAAGPGGIWVSRMTLGNSTIGWPELTSRLARSDADAFTALSEELGSLELEARRSCPICRSAR